MPRVSYFVTAALIGGAICTIALLAGAQGQPDGPPDLPPARIIPGITAEDQFPRGCVDCHIDYPEMRMDTRISTLMERWSEQVDPPVLEAAQAVGGPQVELTGRHPRVDAALDDIPAACLACHRSDATDVPPLAPLLHKLHLGGEGEAVFLRVFQGECTHCHKLDTTTGQWHLPSGPE